ncbi:hypothetical protein OG946_34930 [Streptomyces sp. NBC_01808]|uniref:hypothetical protein n=1 Tax=Streptomyces sp. NBC_01808 TaxID=2975947 RepID=UPI002DDA12D9|nr:hypothetical protein [Streptomyces sp. NBC_01808]WSA42110.1 hypothetical protein OG946_34930 [Streptomyces sp. NBC_01808]
MSNAALGADYARAVEQLAGRVLGALRGTQVPLPAVSDADRPADTTALAAVRVLGPDLFAPALFCRQPLPRHDRETLGSALRVFPPRPGDSTEARWRDRTTAALLARGAAGTRAAVPYAEEDSERAAITEVVEIAGIVEDAEGTELTWKERSQRMARLAPLALPEVDGPYQQRACLHVRALSQGAVRSLMRRDYPTAARLVRWLALAQSRGASPALDVPTALEHLRLWGAPSARTALDLAIAGRLLAGPEGGLR